MEGFQLHNIKTSHKIKHIRMEDKHLMKEGSQCVQKSGHIL